MTDAAGASTMRIGELADRTGLSIRTVRHYDDVGLLHPTGRTEGGFRLYSDDDLQRLLVIRRMKPLGYSLEQMAELLGILDGLQTADGTERDRLQAQLDAYVVDTEERRAKLARNLEWADEFLGILRAH
ncbi:MerR family transcriptional regulator [Curtobacterium flaccumfaciens]|uniref:MerR family transcriptional regulator n=1 Tax=Curtobacterium flaccumfaciens TaxID=2035 RepID=UPI0021CA42B8|nr:MerR family transcriptional regulator [Curtobacterium flaccumfaciens]UXN21905.1 MerR family transcriptional regulator [Curtobacterium flaccumfaciens pv. flaccumfaciens]